MKKHAAVIFATPIVAAMLATGAAAHECPGESTWINQSGSTLHIEDIDSEGMITGHYVNRAAGYGCQNTPYPVTGWVLEGTNTISFTVKWENTQENCQSITSWTGFLSASCSQLTTLWYLVVNGTISSDQILKGADTFTPVAQTTSDFIKKNPQ